MQNRIILILSLLLIINSSVSAQELNCQVNVNHRAIQGTNDQVFQALRKSIFEFMNNTVWTEHVYSANERIECQIMINLTDYNGIDKFTGTLSVQSSRAIYNTNMSSTLMNYKEKEKLFQFEYVENQALDFNINTHLSNLTSVLAFYAYIIIGLDYDTFAMLGGTPYFHKAQQIVSNAQSARESGWKSYESSDETNRYYLVEHILSKQNTSLRRFYYRYHRLGLDKMEKSTEMGRSEIADSFKMMQTTFREKHNSLLLKIILITKMSEIVSIFSEAPEIEKKKVYNILKEIDPSNPKVEQILKKKK